MCHGSTPWVAGPGRASLGRASGRPVCAVRHRPVSVRAKELYDRELRSLLRCTTCSARERYGARSENVGVPCLTGLQIDDGSNYARSVHVPGPDHRPCGICHVDHGVSHSGTTNGERQAAWPTAGRATGGATANRTSPSRLVRKTRRCSRPFRARGGIGG